MTNNDRQPSFMIIGAVKGATTWVAHQLRCHPDLWLPDAEPHYFSTEYDRGPDWYRGLFDPAPEGRIIGEKSASYLAHPDAPARIAAAFPDMRLIVQLRDPVQRAYSDYCMYFRRGMVGPDPRKYLDGGRAEASRFLQGGLYGAHIGRFLDHFPREQLYVIFYESIKSSADAIVADVCRHIGVDVHVAADEIASRKNDSTAPMLPLSLRRLLKPARPLLDPLRSNPLFARARSAMAAPVRYPPLTEELRGMLRDFYQDDLLMLEGLLQQTLPAWCPRGNRAEAGSL
ncbi:MAG: sulfotransferase [Sphingobium sp.]|uniref:sulfotransferase family protein n=1 Tax=Sphingobium sp. TaxID=1912891 RepID=UPI0029B80EDD|nr:sulfotransferase [Sphingobium sp.]MDX3909605.1 sulfotransferase [Sphingobium sp.]